MQKLDDLVTEHLSERLFTPERLTTILASVAALQTQVSDAEEKLKRLYKMVEEGVTDLDDILRDRLASLKLERDRAQSALDRIKARHARKHHDGGYSLPQGVVAVDHRED